MKRKIRGNKEFKIIPEAKLVTGSMQKKCIADDYVYGIREVECAVISHTAACLGISVDEWVSWDSGEDLKVHANAYCDERDEWNEKTGMEVCSSKLDMKNHYRLAKQYSRIYRLLQETAAVVYKLCEMHLKKANAIDDDLVKHYGRLKV